jgi:uncharacterized protein YlxW (UPF0749 family)
MPRGVKGSGTSKQSKSIDVRIAENEAEIAKLNAKIKDLRAKGKELQKLKGKADKAALQKQIEKSNITPEKLEKIKKVLAEG